ncbi:MAG: alpha-amylase family glycosyl hydrolase, partial [Spirochaetota bacterium]
WKGVFGGSAWEWDEKTESWYLHSFLKEQPDLNWRNPEVKKAVFSEIEFWLKKGVDGFRLDVVNLYFKDKDLRSNPIRLTGWQHPRPYEMQNHIYDTAQPEMHPLLKDLRKLLDRYHATSVGEIYVPNGPDPVLASSYLGNNDELHMAFDFSALMQKWSGENFARTMRAWMNQCNYANWPCLVMNNHDQPRSITRYKKGEETDPRAKVLAAMLLTSKGTPFIYAGEEIGMKDGVITKDQLCDPVGIKYWPFNKGRDPERTPMLWDSSENAGFSESAPWLPVNDDYRTRCVAAQEKDPSSVFSWYQSLLAVRAAKNSLRAGQWNEIVTGEKDVFAYRRTYKKEEISVYLNFSNSQHSIPCGNKGAKTLLSTHRKKGATIKGDIVLSPYEALIIQ